jgi:hypothetical protein
VVEIVAVASAVVVRQIAVDHILVVAVAVVVVEDIHHIPHRNFVVRMVGQQEVVQIHHRIPVVQRQLDLASYPSLQTSFQEAWGIVPSSPAFPEVTLSSSSISFSGLGQDATAMTLVGLNSLRRLVCFEQYAAHVNSSNP